MATHWVKWALDSAPTHDRNELLLLVVLAEAANPEGYCWPSKKTLARAMRMDERSIPRIVQRLQAKKLIRVTPRQRTNGSQTSNGYQLLVAYHYKNDMDTHTDIIPSMTLESPQPMTFESSLEPSVEPQKEPKESPAEKSFSKAANVLSPDGDAHAVDASQGETEQGQKILAVKADDSFPTQSLYDREELLPVPGADGPLAAPVLTSPPAPLSGKRGAGQVEKLPTSLIAQGEEGALVLITDVGDAIDESATSLIADVNEAIVMTSPPAPHRRERGERHIDATTSLKPVIDVPHIDTGVIPKAPKPVIDVPRGRAGTKSDLSSSSTHSHKAQAGESHPSSQSGAMLAAVAFAFKIPQGAYAGKIGQFFKGSIPRKRKDLWAHHQPEQAATPQEVMALYLWYSRHASYVKSCLEHGGRLPATPSILRDRLDEFRDAPGYAQAMQAAAPLLEKLLRGETIAAPAPQMLKASTPTGPIESAAAYKNYNPKHDPAYQRAVDADAAAAAFEQVFGR